MSREKDTEDGDRQGLVEEGTVSQPDKLTKDTKGSVEAKWVHETAAKPSAAAHSMRPIPHTSGLPEVMTTTGESTTILIHQLSRYYVTAFWIFLCFRAC